VPALPALPALLPWLGGPWADHDEVTGHVRLPGGPMVRDPYAGAAGLSWWKGQLHTHTARSYDGDPSVLPARRAAHYQAAGYDFAVLTDHDRVSTVPL
jgi:hypothetical protein